MTTTPELSVIVPCLDEEPNLPELVLRVGATFSRGGFEGELVIVDDGSTDGSPALLEALRREHAFVVVRRHASNRGIAQAWKTGLAASRGRLVSILDADLQYQPEDLLRLRRELYESHVDIVQGWRSTVGRARGPRYYWSRGLNTLLNGAFGMDLRDNKSGFLVCPREVLADLLSYRGHYHYWQTFLMVAAHARGYTYKQVETLFEPRRAGKSFLDDIPVKSIARTFSDLGRGLLEYRLRTQRRDPLRGFLERPANAAADAPAAPPVVDRSPEYRGARRAHLEGYLATFSATHWLMTRDVRAHLSDLRRSQWLSREAIREIQDWKLRRLVRHAYGHVPFYRERMRALELVPEDIRGVEDLARLPFLTKQDVREHLYFDIMSDNHDKAEVLRITTSGSTGEPFVCYADRAQLEFRWAATQRAMEWTGWRFGDRQVRLWHQTLGMTRTQVLREKTDAWLSRRRFIPAYEMTDETLEAFVRSIVAWNPALLDGYAESFNFLARWLENRGSLSLRPKGGSLGLRPKGIISSAQTLPDTSRRIIEEAFGCRVFDKYGSREFSGIAYECDAHEGHHVVGEGYLVEVLRDGRPAEPGEVGEIVITDLNNYCMPFIRYRIGDLAEAMPDAPCACGRGLPRIGRIEGRVQSIIVGAGGRYVPGTFFAHLLKDYDHAIRQFQIVQERRGAVVLRVVKGGRYSPAVLEEILGILARYLGAETAVEVRFEDNIDLGRTGKRLATVSRLGLDFQALSQDASAEVSSREAATLRAGKP